MKIKLKYIKRDSDRHGNLRIFVLYRGRKIRIREQPGTAAFMLAYNAALESLEQPHEHARRTDGRIIVPGSLAALAAKYFDSKDFTKLDAISQRTRRGIIEDCLREKTADIPGSKPIGDMPAKLFNASHMKWLMELKADLQGAANNRRKWFSVMLGWAIQTSPPLVSRNAARDVKVSNNETDGFYTWSEDDITAFETRHPVGSKARLALALLVYTGLRRSDVVRIGKPNIRAGNLELTPVKTKDVSPDLSFKPVLPELAAIIAATPTIGLHTFLVTEWGKPFTANGFGNWFKDRCMEAGLPKCSAHGLRKAGACRCAEKGASVPQLMALFDWKSPAVAIRYIKKANKKRMTADVIGLLSRRDEQSEI